MQHQNINFGSGPGAGDGETIHSALTKVEGNTRELHAPTQRIVTASFNITANDIAGVIVVDSATPVIGTIQADIVTGAGRVQIIQRGAGAFQLVGANGVTLGHPLGHRRSTGQDAVVELIHAGGNHWNLDGALAAPALRPLLPTSTTAQIDEGVSVGTVVASLAVTEGEPTSVSLTGPNASRFSVVIVSPTLVRVLTAQAIDYDAAASYGFTVTATNFAGSSICDLTVTVREVQAPVLVGADFRLVETASVGAQFGTIQNISDPATSWAITAGNGAGLFSIANGVLRLEGALDYATADRHTLTITASNVGGTSQPVTVNVYVTEVNVVGATTLVDFDVDHNGETGAISSFVVPFAVGDVPAASVSTIGVRRRDTGEHLRTQFEPRTFHPNGDVLTAELSVELPAGTDGQIIQCMLRRGDPHPTPGSAINLATALSSRTCSVTITPIAGGSPWTLNVVSAAAASGNPWNAGPLKASKRVIADVPASALGGTCQSMRCVVDLVYTSDGTIRSDVQMRNDKAFGGTNAAATYTYQVTCDGTAMPAVVMDGLTAATRLHHSNGWFLREYATKAGGAAAPRRPIMRMPMYQIARAGLLPYIDGENGLPTGSQAFRSDWMYARPGTWDQPFDGRGISYNMGGSGGQTWIGPITMRQAAIWYTTWNRTIVDLSCDEAEAACGWPIHFWDAQNGEWLNKVRRPTHVSSKGGGSPWDFGPSHHPCPHTVAYMLTCRRSLMDGLQAVATWLSAQYNDAYTGAFSDVTLGSAGEAARRTQLLTTGEGLVQIRRTQMRSGGWTIRTMAHAAAVTPAAEQPFGDFLPVALRSQFVWLLGRRATYQAWCGTTAGWYADWSYGGEEGFYPNWQHAFVTVGVYTAAALGVPEAAEWLRFTANWTLGQYENPNDVPRFDGVNYLRQPANGALNTASFAKSWADLNNIERAAGWTSNGNNPPPWTAFLNPSARGYYPRWYLADVALQAAFWIGRDSALAARTATLLDALVMADNAAAGDTTWESAVHLQTCRYWYGRQATNEAMLPIGRTRGPRAPTIPAQTITVPESATVGQPVGAVHWEGNVFNTGWEIVGGSSVFSISRAGVLTLLQPLDHDTVSTYALTVRALNPNGNATGSITINVQSQAPSLQDGVAVSRPANLTVGNTVATLTVGGAPSTLSITSGDPTNRFTISNSGVITLAAALTGLSGQVFTLGISATNAFGTDTTTVQVTVTAAVFVPAINQNQVFIVGQSAANGTVIGTPTAGGSAVVTWRILSGNTGGRVAINASTGEMTVAAPFTGLPAGGLSLLIEAENTAGADQRAISIVVAEAQTVFNTPTNWLGLYSLRRRLRAAYAGPLVRLRRAADGVEADFGVTGGGVLDEAAITAWVNAAPVGQRDSYVVTLYDQSLRGQHLTQATSTRQPRFTTTSGGFYLAAAGASQFPTMDLEGGLGLTNGAFTTEAAVTMGAVVAMHARSGPYLPHLVGIEAPGGNGSFGGQGRAALIRLGAGGNSAGLSRDSTLGYTTTADHGATYAPNTPQTVAAVITGPTTAKLWIKDDRDDFTIGNVGPLVNPADLRIGVMNAGSATGAFSGRIYEIVIFVTTADPDADVASIEANIRTAWGFGPPVEVAPNIDPEPQSLPAVAANAAPGVTVGTVATIAGTAATWSITAGNTGGQFAVSNAGVVTVAAALTVGNYALTVRAENGAGWDEATINVEVSGAVAPPAIAASQVFDVQEPVAQGATIGDIAWTGGTPSTWTEVSGDPGNRLSLNAAGRITAAVRIVRDDVAQIVPVIRAGNSGGNSADTPVTINITANPLAYGTAGTKFLGAWALRRIRATYTGPLVRLRRASDGTVQDWSAVDVGGGLFMLDAAALATWAQGGKVFVTRWYDQSLRGQDLVQTVQALQPEICDAAGAVITAVGTGGRPAIRFTGGGVGLNNLAFDTGGMQHRAIYVQFSKDEASAATQRRMVSFSPTVNGFDTALGGFSLTQNVTIFNWTLGYNQAYVSTAKAANEAAIISARYAFGESPTMPLWYNGVGQNTASAGSEAALTDPGFLRIGCRDESDTTLSFLGRMSELVLAGDSPDADRQLIETSIRTFIGF